MIANLKPYPAMKDSGVAWIGSVPQHWELRRTKTLLSQRSEKGFPDEPLLAATQTKGVVRKDEYENRTVLALKDLQLLKLVRIGDFVISLRSFQGGIEFARHRGIISPAYTILYTVDRVHHAYLSYLFKSLPLHRESLALCDGDSPRAKYRATRNSLVRSYRCHRSLNRPGSSACSITSTRVSSDTSVPSRS